jgi:hypothetical protein
MEKRDLVLDRASRLCTVGIWRKLWLILDLNLHALRHSHSLGHLWLLSPLNGDHHGLTGGSAGWYLHLDLLAI